MSIRKPDKHVSVTMITLEDGRLSGDDDYDPTMLFQKRDDLKTSDGRPICGLFGGHIEQGETPDQALRRELLEELPDEAKRLVGARWRCVGDIDFVIPGTSLIARNTLTIIKRLELSRPPESLRVCEGLGAVAWRYSEALKSGQLPPHVQQMMGFVAVRRALGFRI